MRIATSITIEKKLIDKIDIMAEKEGRNRSNMIEQILKEEIENIETEINR